MDTSWLELLSNIDKMVLGSIVGSVVLAFILVVVIFSYKLKQQQDRIVLLQSELDDAILEITNVKSDRDELERKNEDAMTIVEHYQSREEELKQEAITIQTERDKALKRVEKLKNEAANIKKEKKELNNKKNEAELQLQKAQEEIEAVLKRNEFWVEQLSELRTKYDALTFKLKSFEKR